MENVGTDDSTGGQFENPGYEYLKLIYLMKEAQANDSSQDTSPHFFPLLALQSACLAIEEYIDLVGRKIDPVWNEPGNEIDSIKRRVAHIYKKTGKPVDFKKGIWKETFTLFDMAGLIQRNPSEFRNAYEAEIPEVYKDVATKYPIHLSLAIVEQAVEALLNCSKQIFP